MIIALICEKTSSLGIATCSFLHLRNTGKILYGMMSRELILREIRIDQATGRANLDSQMTNFKVNMPLKLQSTMKALL